LYFLQDLYDIDYCSLIMPFHGKKGEVALMLHCE
jgi:hypothetical protein